jgi:hypothetical protein
MILVPFPLPLPVGYGSRVTRIEPKENDVGLVDDFVQHADAVSPLLFLRAADVESDGAKEMKLPDADCELG